MKVHLVDGTYELFRTFYGAPSATGQGGEEVGAVRGLVATLLALLKNEGATHVAVAFDHVIESFRNDLFDGYKTGDGIDPRLRSQFALAEDAARALGLVVWPMVDFEADDALAAGAHRYKTAPGVEQVLLCSPDKDLGQCVEGDRVVLRDRRRKLTLDEAAIREKHGVAPHQIPDLLALVGDSADGIPGVPKWGAVSAATVLGRWGHVEAIPREAARWDVKVRGAEALCESLNAHRDEASLYKTLATLRTDAPIAEELSDLEWRGARRAEMEALCARLQDDKLLERVPRFAE